MCTVSRAQELPLELSRRGVYLCEGFDRSLTRDFPPTGNEWTQLSSSTGLETVSFLRKEWTPLTVLGSSNVVEYTLLTTFFADRYRMESYSLALVIPGIGENWEVLLNGDRIDSHLYYDGYMLAQPAYYHTRVVEIPHRLLRDGYNVVAFRIIGRVDSPYCTVAVFDPGCTVEYYSDSRNTEKAAAALSYSTGTLLAAVLLLLAVFCLLNITRTESCYLLLVGMTALVYHPLVSGALLRIRTDAYLYGQSLLIPLSITGMVLFLFSTLTNRRSLLFWTTAGGVFAAGAAGSLLLPLQCDRSCLYAFLLQSAIVAVLVCRGRIRDADGTGTFRERFTILSVLVLAELMAVVLVAAPVYDLRWQFHFVYFMTAFTWYAVFHSLLHVVETRQEKRMRVSRIDILERNEQMQEDLAAARDTVQKLTDENASLALRLHTDESIRSSDADIASVVQRYIFPKNPPQTKNFDIGLHFNAAGTVSGDMYDFYLDRGYLLGLSLFESTSDGLAPALVSILSRSIIYRRFTQYRDRRLSYIFDLVKQDLQTELSGRNIYLSGQILKCDGPVIEYVNAGHTDMIYRNGRSKQVKLVSPRGMQYKSPKLGGVDGFDYSTLTFTLNSGDMLIVYSDGFEQGGRNARIHGSVRRINETVENIPENLDASGTAEYLMKNYYTSLPSGSPRDDATLVVRVKR